MSAKVLSAAVLGLEAEIVEVEADMGGGELGHIAIVGLPDASVSESRERVRSAIRNSSLFLPKQKITINLAPADLKKYGPSYDLPIAVSLMLAANSFFMTLDTKKTLFVGELALSGRVRGVNGILPITLKAREEGIDTIFVPTVNAKEAKLVENIQVVPVKSLRELIDHLTGRKVIEAIKHEKFSFSNQEVMFDMKHIQGQEHVKRAMEIVAAGGHNMAMSGPPGSGKTLIARTLPSILPNLSLEEALEVTKIYSVAGELKDKQALITSRPFRSPHHTASGVALVGGGAWPRPGEISMAHRGVLFLDEFAEFPRTVLENLRQPLEDGVINVSRAAGNLRFPAKFVLISAMNPCPCGYASDPEKECECTQNQILNYKRKISGPIIDRIDLHVEVPRIDFEKLSSDCVGEASKDIKKRVERTRVIQLRRFKNLPFITNAEMNQEAVKKFCILNEVSKKILGNAVEQMHLSARSYFRILKLSRTIADIEEQEEINEKHIAEALQYRPKT